MKLSRNYPRWRYRHKRTYLVYRYWHEKPVCRPPFLETNQESRKWFILSMQWHRVLNRCPLSQKEYETNPSKEQNNAAVFANRISRRKIKITSLTKVTVVSTANVCQERKNRYSECYQVLYPGPKSARNILTNLSPNPTQAQPNTWPDPKARLTTLLPISFSDCAMNELY